MFEQFMTWLAEQPRETKYDGMDIYSCALQQFGQSLNPDKCVRGYTRSFGVRDTPGDEPESEAVDIIPYGHPLYNMFGRACVSEQYFGPLLDRLNEERRKANV